MRLMWLVETSTRPQVDSALEPSQRRCPECEATPRPGVITALQGWGLNIAASLLLLMRHRGRIGRAVQPVHRWQRAYASACRLPVLMIVSSRRLHYTGDVIQAARYTGSSAPLI